MVTSLHHDGKIRLTDKSHHPSVPKHRGNTWFRLLSRWQRCSEVDGIITEEPWLKRGWRHLEFHHFLCTTESHLKCYSGQKPVGQTFTLKVGKSQDRMESITPWLPFLFHTSYICTLQQWEDTNSNHHHCWCLGKQDKKMYSSLLAQCVSLFMFPPSWEVRAELSGLRVETGFFWTFSKT